MNLQQFLLILRARYRIILFALLATVGAAAVVSLMQSKRYTANANVVVDVKSPDPLAGQILPALTQPGYMATQIDIINSRRVTQRVVKLLKLDSDPEIVQKWRDATEGKGDLLVWLSDSLQGGLKVNPSKDSNVISLTYTSTDPEYAATVANAFAQAYIDVNLELRVEPATQNAQWFKQKTADLRQDVMKAQAKLSDYQQKRGFVVATDGRIDSETQKLNELSSQYTLAQAQTADSQSKKVVGGSDTISDVMNSPVIMNLKTQISGLEGQLQELAGNVGVNHPQYQRLTAQIASLKKQLGSETEKINSSVTTANRVSQVKQGEIRAAIEAQKKVILKLRQERDEVAVMIQEVEAAQKAYDAVAARFTQTSLESQTSQTNIAVLTPASVPRNPSSPKIPLNIALGLVIGIMIGVGAAVLLELIDRRVRSSQDIIDLLGIPVLGVIVKADHSSSQNKKRLSVGSFGVNRTDGYSTSGA